MVGALSLFVADQHGHTVHREFAEKTLAQIARNPHAVDKSLVIGMDGNDVFSAPQKRPTSARMYPYAFGEDGGGPCMTKVPWIYSLK